MPAFGVNLQALSSMLIRTCSIWPASKWSTGISQGQVDRDAIALVVGERRDFVQGLLEAFPDIGRGADSGRFFTWRPTLNWNMAAAMRESRLVLCCMRCRTSRWFLVERAQGLTEEQPAIAADGGERSPEIVHGPGQKVGAVLVVFLQLQVGLDEALQNLVAVGAQAAGGRHPLFVRGDGQPEEGGQGCPR